MGVRCFVALAVSREVTECIEQTTSALAGQARQFGTRVSWSRLEGWHVTLKFLGEIDEPTIEAVHRVLVPVAASVEPLRLTACGLVTLPRRGLPRVLAVSIDGGEGLARLAGRIDEGLSAIGFDREHRPFVGHLTVGRVRDGKGWDRWEGAFRGQATRSFGSWLATGFGLYRSEIGQGPARYTVLEHYRLGRGSETEGKAPVEGTFN